MLQFFLNPVMLAGLAGVGLPVVAHLLSRRKYDVVQWGAMQFLNPSRKTRRKLKLEELLLLLIRMSAIALLAFAASRPWISSGFLTGYRSAGSRDVVLVIDGSNSMSRSDGLTNLHQKAIRRANEFLASLRPGDTVAVIDARDQPIPIVKSPLQNHDVVREKLKSIPPPAGAGDLQRACEEAVGILGRCSNGAREIIVFSDRQRSGWSPSDSASWERFEDVLNFPSVRPDLWVVDVSNGLGAIRNNVSLGRIKVSRDLTVPNFPVSFQVPVRNSGSEAVNVPLQILTNGQRVANLDATVSVPPQSETVFSRSISFTGAGTNIVTIKLSLPDDPVAADNATHAAVQVTSAVPVLLVENSDSLNRSHWNTFFASLALTSPDNKSPWIVAKTVKANDLTAVDLQSVAAVVLADVTELPEGLPQQLLDYATRGNGVFLCLGRDTSPESFQKLYAASGLLPTVRLTRMKTADPDAATPATVAPYSLESEWLNRFRERKGASLLKAIFRQWWLVETGVTAADDSDDSEAGDNASTIADRGLSSLQELIDPPVTVAQLNTGDPLLLQAACGRGSVLMMTSNIDTSMNNLPTTPDYVPFLHEALFQMAASRVQRNVRFGQPLIATVPNDDAPSDATTRNEPRLSFATPYDESLEAELRPDNQDWIASLPATRFPGVYELHETDKPEGKPLDAFVINYDHEEDNPEELTADDRARLIVNDRMTFVDSLDQLQKQMYGNESRSELWAWLLWLFLGLLLVEVWMTRRLVMNGHAGRDGPPADWSLRSE